MAGTRKGSLQQLKGWNEIADFLGQHVSVAERWARSGMPVAREGRRVYADPAQLNQWLGRESSGEPVVIASPATDLASELRRGLKYAQKTAQRKPTPSKKSPGKSGGGKNETPTE